MAEPGLGGKSADTAFLGRMRRLSVAIPLELPTVPIYMIWHETRRHDAAHLWLRDLVAGELGRAANGSLSSNCSRARARRS